MRRTKALQNIVLIDGVDATSPRSASPTNARRSSFGIANRPAASAAIVWQDRRTAGVCDELRAAGLRALAREDRPRARSVLLRHQDRVDSRPRRRRCATRARRGELAFGTIDTWLVHKLTGGKRARHRRIERLAHAAVRHHTGDWDDELLALLQRAARLLPEIRAPRGSLRRNERQRRAATASRSPASRAISRPPSSARRASSRHGEEHLRHRLLHAA